MLPHSVCPAKDDFAINLLGEISEWWGERGDMKSSEFVAAWWWGKSRVASVRDYPRCVIRYPRACAFPL